MKQQKRENQKENRTIAMKVEREQKKIRRIEMIVKIARRMKVKRRTAKRKTETEMPKRRREMTQNLIKIMISTFY